MNHDSRDVHQISLRDLFWLLAYPAYQLLGTIRHEGSHALAVLLEGGKVTKFVFWPTWGERFYWGYVRWSGHLDWKVSAAPYLVDLVWFVAFYFICTRARFKRHWVWVNVYIIGLVSPLIDSLYRYISSFFRDGDLTSVYAAAPAWTVHAYFILTSVLYIAALVRIQLARSPRERDADGENFDAFVDAAEHFVVTGSELQEGTSSDGDKKKDADTEWDG